MCYSYYNNLFLYTTVCTFEVWQCLYYVNINDSDRWDKTTHHGIVELSVVVSIHSLMHLALLSLSHSYLVNYREMLYFLQREVSFVHYLELNIVIKVIGWIYCIAWIIGFYPQVCSEYVQEWL